MANCSFCGLAIPIGTGVTFFKRTGATLHYCSRKCAKNYSMGRSPRKRKWVRSRAKAAAAR